MSPLGCQKMSAKPCNRNAEESFPVLSLKSREQKPPNPLLIQDKDVLQPTSRHFCPHATCDYRGWLGLGNLRANGHPNGGPWRQFHCTACDGYFPEHHGTI